MHDKYKKTVRYIKGIDSQTQYEKLMNETRLSDVERDVCFMRYVKGKNFGFIADMLGYSYRNTILIHKRAVEKAGSVARELGLLED